MEQHHIDVFVDALGNTLLWAFTNESRYIALFGFGSADMTTATLMAFLGACLGSFINYGLGRIVALCQSSGLSLIEEGAYATWQRRFTYAMPLIGLFSWIHLTGVVVFAAGFLHVPARYALPALMLGQGLFYLYQYNKFIAL